MSVLLIIDNVRIRSPNIKSDNREKLDDSLEAILARGVFGIGCCATW